MDFACLELVITSVITVLLVSFKKLCLAFIIVNITTYYNAIITQIV